MVVFDALTFVAMIIASLLSLICAGLTFPEVSAFFVIAVYYFLIFHIAHVVGKSKGWYRDILPTYFATLVITILTFAIIYYRYGLLQNGIPTKISFVDSIYFSITTWSTLGYGDFAPIPRIRLITSIEAIIGYVGLGLWISLISNFIKNMVDNRKFVVTHNEKLLAEQNENKDL